MESLDLGLPYEVQHCILSIIQRVLEEGCFEFACRWLPQMLKEHNWTCPEAVELATWRKVLPTTNLPASFVYLRDYSLEVALRDAVQVRNAAVHRHLSTNSEIRQMALKAQKLMSMFSDATRQYRFDFLRSELWEWEAGSKINDQAAKERLQQALQEIAERPMSDMDWTPNSISLQEISTDAESLQDIDDHYADEMELD